MNEKVKGYLLIKLVPGMEALALSQIRSMRRVEQVNFVFGEWDAIALVEADSLFELANVVVGEVRSIQGVRDTTTIVQGGL